MRSAASAEPRTLTSWRVLVAVVAAVIVIVAIGTWAVRVEIRSRTLDGTVEGAAVLTSVVLDRTVTYSDITRGMNPAHRAELNADVILLKRRGEVVSLAIWSMATGELVYTDTDPAAKHTPPPEVMTRAEAGRPFVTTSGGGDQIDAVVVYYPYDANGDGTVDAVAEVALPSTRVDESIMRSTRMLYLGGAAVLLLALAGILRVRRHQLRQDYAAAHDALTGLGNRLLLRRVFPTVLTEASAGSPAALLLIDLDNFKAVNDTLGHHAGDELLVTVAHAIKEAGGPSSVAVRIGGDEFALLLPEVRDCGHARDTAARIRDRIRQPVTIAGCAVEVDASVGLAWAPADGTELSDLICKSDMAMYWAKRAGTGVAEYAQVAQTARPRLQPGTVADLGRAMADHELELYYQPLRACDGAVTSVEALARWHHPEQGLLDMDVAVPAVAQPALESTLTEWMLGEAARQCARWRASGLDLTVSVNVSARSLYSESLLGLVRGVVEDSGLPLSALELEVSEAILVAEPTPALLAMRRLHDAGVGLCLDNFGAAYGAVSTVTEAPIGRLKIDRRFGGSVVNDPLATAVVSGWIKVAHELGLVVVAQGVETPSGWQCLIDLGCDEAQGHGIGRPMPAAELAEWVSRPTPA